MSDQPDKFTLIFLRMDAKLDRVLEELSDLKQRVTALEIAQARTRQDLAEVSASVTGLQLRLDRMDVRLDRIERRLDLQETSP